MHQLIPARPGALSRDERSPDALAARFLAGYSGRTRESYADDLRGYWVFCGAHRIDVLTAERAHIELFARALELRGLAPSTVGRRLSAIAGLYRYAEQEAWIERSPVTFVRRPRCAEESPTEYLDKDEALRFLAVAADPRDRTLACLLLLNGLRVTEACGADAEGLATERGHRVLTIHGKGGRRDRVPLAPATVEAIEAVLGGRTSGPVLIGRTAAGYPKRLGRRDATRMVKRLAKAAAVDKRISPHSLRHSFITLSLDAGASLRDVQDAARHADPRTTRRYDRARFSLNRHATYTLATFLGEEAAA